MAIPSNAVVEYFGTQAVLGTTSATISNDSFSTSSDLAFWTNTDNAPSASVTLACTFLANPSTFNYINLYARLLDVQGTNDNVISDAGLLHSYVGQFPVDNTSAAQYITIDIRLPNAGPSQKYEFYLSNKAGQSVSAGWDLFVTPKTLGPKV